MSLLRDIPDWKKLPIFWREVEEKNRFREQEDGPDIYDTLRKKALDGDIRAIGLWAKMWRPIVGGDKSKDEHAQ